MSILQLIGRSVIRLQGADSKTLLQGLITNDINALRAGNALYAGLLTPQGKFLFDMLIVADGNDILLEVETNRKADLMRRLMMYKLRADVDIIDENLAVWVSTAASTASITDIIYRDPRHPNMPQRIMSASNPAPDAGILPSEDYETLRITCGVPDGSRDMAVEKYFWLETNAEALNGVSFSKGCYVGQELTARMKHRTTVKKRLMTINAIDGKIVEGDTITNDNGRAVGTVHTSCREHAIAYLRIEHITPTMKTGNAIIELYDQN